MTYRLKSYNWFTLRYEYESKLYDLYVFTKCQKHRKKDFELLQDKKYHQQRGFKKNIQYFFSLIPKELRDGLNCKSVDFKAFLNNSIILAKFVILFLKFI